MTKTPARPSGVPPRARWVPEDSEWELGPLVDGQKHGDFTYWRPDGTRCNECHFERGTVQGPFKRFHENGEVSQDGTFVDGQLHGLRRWFASDEPTTERMHEGGISTAVRRTEMDYVHGRVVAIRHFDGAGQRVLPSGEAYPRPPAGVDARAEYVPPQEQWHLGQADGETQAREGRWRIWTKAGQLLEDAEYVQGQRHGRAWLSLGPPTPCADERVVAEEGQYEHGTCVGAWQLLDGAGQPVGRYDYGRPFGGDVARLAAWSNATTPEALATEAAQLEGGAHWAAALATWARWGGVTKDLGPFQALLARVARRLKPEAAEALAEENDGEAARLVASLIDGWDPALVLNKVAIALDQGAQSRAALDFNFAASLLAPERTSFLFTRSLILMSLGLAAQARVDANELAASQPEQAEFLLSYLDALFPRFEFQPARETPTSTFEELPERPVRSLEEVRALAQKYATRLGLVRDAILERVTPAAGWVPPDLSVLVPGEPAELLEASFEVEDADGDVQTISLDETLALARADLPTLARLARADWVALCWLCWSAGLDAVGLPEQLSPPEDFGQAAGMAQQRLWRARDQRVFQGRNAEAHGIPSFEWEGLDVGELASGTAGIVEQQYADMQALFMWLCDADVKSPWQDNLRGS